VSLEGNFSFKREPEFIFPYRNTVINVTDHSVLEVDDEVVEDGGVDVLGQLHQDEVVSEPALLHHRGDIAALVRTAAAAKHQKTSARRCHEGDSEAEEDPGPDCHADEPEPEEDVDLLDDDVDGEDAESVMVLDGSRSSVLVEGALGHLGEHPGHGVHPVLHLRVGHAEDVQPISGELSSQEGVHEVHLPHDVDEVEDLAEDELVDVEVMAADGAGHPVHDHSAPILRRLALDHGFVEFLYEHADLSSLPRLPDEVREVAEDSLEEEYEADPLVPGVPDLVPVLRGLDEVRVIVGGATRTNSWVRVILTGTTSELLGESECSVYPAVGIENFAGDSLIDTGDGVSKELSGSGEEAASSKNHKSHLVVKPECRVVDQTPFRTNPFGNGSKKSQHFNKVSTENN